MLGHQIGRRIAVARACRNASRKAAIREAARALPVICAIST